MTKYKRIMSLLLSVVIVCGLLVGCQNNASNELPNGWRMDDFVVAGFDKDGPGDFGYRAFLSEDEIKSLSELLDLSEWQELTNPPEYGLTVCLSLSDSDLERIMYVQDGVDGKAVIKLIDRETGESFLYLASVECVSRSKELAAKLKDRASAD